MEHGCIPGAPCCAEPMFKAIACGANMGYKVGVPEKEKKSRVILAISCMWLFLGLLQGAEAPPQTSPADAARPLREYREFALGRDGDEASSLRSGQDCHDSGGTAGCCGGTD